MEGGAGWCRVLQESMLQCVLFSVLMPYLGMESNRKVHQWYSFGSNKRKDCEELYLDIMRLNVQDKKSSIGECKMTHMDK